MRTQASFRSKHDWGMILLRRASAVVVDVMVALLLAFLISFLIETMGFIKMGVSFKFITMLLFILERTVGISLGNEVSHLAVINSSVGKNFLRVLALIIPVINLLDWAYAFSQPEHRTFIDKKLGVRVIDSATIF